MRLFVIFLFTTLALAAQAQRSSSTPLMVCLGREEKTLHLQKLGGPAYDLNQRLIGELVLINRIDATPAVLRKICRPGHSPALELLEEMLLNPQGWARFRGAAKGVEANIAQELVKELNLGTPEIFLNYLSQLQGQAPDPQCLSTHIPGLKSLHEEVKFLQEEIDLTKITADKKRMKRIFAGIRNAPKFFAKCREALQASSKSKNNASATGKPSAQ